MKVLFLYPNHVGYFRCPIGLTLIMTMCKNEGHEVHLFDTTFMNVEENKDQDKREETGQVKPVTLDGFFNKKSKNEIESLWLSKIEEINPDMIATSIVEDSYLYCDRLLGLAKKNFNTPVVVGGSMPTVVPQIVIQNPNIDFVVEGEAEIAFVELLKTFKTTKDFSNVPNLWYKEKNKTKKTGLVKYISMDKVPYMHLDFWDEKHFYKPYNGKLHSSGFFEFSRGCMHKCHYCINRAFQVFQADAGKVRRNKSPDAMIEEVLSTKVPGKRDRFDLIMFADDNFLGRQPDELDEFFKKWEEKVKIPYWINTCIETVNDRNLPGLKKSGCVGIGIGLETGSDWVRKHLLFKGKMDNKFYLEKFGLMIKHKIRVTANNIIGVPGEYEQDFFETIKLNKAIRELANGDDDLTSFDVSYMAPYMGTVMQNIAMEMKLIDVHEHPGFQGMSNADINMRYGPTMKNPCMSRERIIELSDDFQHYVNGTKPIPEKFLNIDPMRRFADNDEILELYEKYKQGPVDPLMVVPKDSIRPKEEETIRS